MSLTKSAYWDYITSEEYEQDMQPSNYVEAVLRAKYAKHKQHTQLATAMSTKPSRNVLEAFKQQGWYEGSQAVRKRLVERFKRNKTVVAE